MYFKNAVFWTFRFFQNFCNFLTLRSTNITNITGGSPVWFKRVVATLVYSGSFGGDALPEASLPPVQEAVHPFQPVSLGELYRCS